MEHVSPSYLPIEYRGGGRVASPEYRQSLALCDDFVGLEENVDRYDLLLLVKRAGKLAGFTPRMIQLLDYYMAYTRQVDWEEGSRPIVYQSLSKTAIDLGISERWVQKIECQLFSVGSVAWNDSGNHRRYGQRDPETGRILYAFGVDLTPLAYLREELERKLAEKQRYDAAWMEIKRQISWHRRQIRALIAEWSAEEGACALSIRSFDRRYNEIAIQIRTHLDLEALKSLLARHKSLYSALIAEMGVGAPEPVQRPPVALKTEKSTPRSVPAFAHYKSTTQESFDKSNTSSPKDRGFQESVADPSLLPDPVQSSGMEHVRLGMAIEAASEQLAIYLPKNPGWPDLIEAATRLRPELGVSQASWGDACRLLGRTGAALCLLVTDQAALRSENAVRQPAAYFRGMVNRARVGELRLHSSIFGLLSR
jgi:hypothetical protein